MRRRQAWKQHREQGWGSGTLHNATYEDLPQGSLTPPEARPSITFNHVGPAIDAILDLAIYVRDGKSLRLEPDGDGGFVVPSPVDPNACPKCGRILNPRGKHFHVRKCEGVKP